MHKNVHGPLLTLGVMGPIIFFIIMYLVLPSFYPDYNSANQHISQLGAVDSPVKIFANVLGFYTFGVSLILFSLATLRLQRLDKGHRLSAVFLMLTGISVSLVSFFPCDKACAATTGTGIVHLALAGTQLLFLVLSVFTFSLSKPLEPRFGPRIRLMFYIWLVPSLLWFSNVILGFHNEGVGLIQRISLGMTYAFVVLQGIIYSAHYKKINFEESI
jgi:hypothetical membrane protein